MKNKNVHFGMKYFLRYTKTFLSLQCYFNKTKHVILL